VLRNMNGKPVASPDPGLSHPNICLADLRSLKLSHVSILSLAAGRGVRGFVIRSVGQR
jgi:hypothetical protein